MDGIESLFMQMQKVIGTWQEGLAGVIAVFWGRDWKGEGTLAQDHRLQVAVGWPSETLISHLLRAL